MTCMLCGRYSRLTSSCTIECQEDQEELSPSPTEEPWPKKFPEPLSWRSDEEDEDSDFGEEQRDRYLKVLFLVWKDYISEWKCFLYICMVSFLFQVSISAEHQEFFIFLQRFVSPVLEAYSGAAIFIHSLSQPTSESDYTQKLFRYLLTRSERGLAVYGNSAKTSPTQSQLSITQFPCIVKELSCWIKMEKKIHFKKLLFSGITTLIFKVHGRSNIRYLSIHK